MPMDFASWGVRLTAHPRSGLEIINLNNRHAKPVTV